MKQFITLVLWMLPFIMNGQIANLKEGNLRGKVRSVKLNHYKVMTEGDSIWGEIAPDNDPFWFNGYIDTYFVFDREGRTSEYHSYFDADADDNKTVNTYNKEGRLQEQRFFADGRKTGSMTYEYDDEGRITEVIRYDADGTETDRVRHFRKPHQRIPRDRGHNNIWLYTYNDKGECIEERCLLPNNKYAFRHIFFYDEAGRQKRSVFFDQDNIQTLTTSFSYDKRDLIHTIIRISPAKKLVTRYKYDEYDNIIYVRTREVDIPSQRGLPEKEDKRSETASIYEYDDRGNWIERIVLDNGTPVYIQKREIKYY